jgi:hypothetical protein
VVLLGGRRSERGAASDLPWMTQTPEASFSLRRDDRFTRVHVQRSSVARGAVPVVCTAALVSAHHLYHLYQRKTIYGASLFSPHVRQRPCTGRCLDTTAKLVLLGLHVVQTACSLGSESRVRVCQLLFLPRGPIQCRSASLPMLQQCVPIGIPSNSDVSLVSC